MGKTKRECALELRAQGMTYKQIAESLGSSIGYISQLISAYNPHYFRIITEEGCIYPGLRNWMNANQVSRAELVRRMGQVTWATTVATMGHLMRGKYEPTKGTIDGILKVTGLSYEECFGGAENG